MEQDSTTQDRPPLAVTVQTNCTEFLRLMAGESLGNYLSHCQELKTWRDDFVATAVNNAELPRNTTQLQRLIDVEYNCGEGALLKRSKSLVAAFTLVRSSQNHNPLQAQQSVRQRRYEGQSKPLDDALLEAHTRQQQRLNNETQQLWNQLEHENLRQQIDNSVDYGRYPFQF
jgi:hypothetical protein